MAKDEGMQVALQLETLLKDGDAAGGLQECIQQLGRSAGEFTSLIAALVLGSFGSFMSSSTLWMCWTILLLKLLTDYSIRPSWMWVTSYLGSRLGGVSPSNNGSSSYTTSECATASGITLTTADQVRGEASTVCIKIVLAVGLLVNARSVNDRNFSAGCSRPPCSDRAKQSVRGLAVTVMLLEGIPVLLSFAQLRVWENGITRLNRSFHLLQHAIREFKCDPDLTWLNFALIVQSFQASASSAVIVLTGGLLVGGNFSNFMRGQCFVVCWSIVVAELLAEGACPIAVSLFRFWKPHATASVADQESVGDAGNSDRFQTNRRLREEAIGKLLLRVPVQAVLCVLLILIVRHRTYYYKDLSTDLCDETCERNTRTLLKVMCAFTGSQVLSIFPLWAPLQILAALLPAFLTYGLLYIIITIGPIAIAGLLSLIVWGMKGALAVTTIMVFVYSALMMARKSAWLSPLVHLVMWVIVIVAFGIAIVYVD